MLLQVIALQECRLSGRVAAFINCPVNVAFLEDFVDTACFALLSSPLRASMLSSKLGCDLAHLSEKVAFSKWCLSFASLVLNTLWVRCYSHHLRLLYLWQMKPVTLIRDLR